MCEPDGDEQSLPDEPAMTSKNPLESIQTPDLLKEQMERLKAEFPDLFTMEGQLNPAELLRLTGQKEKEHFDFSWWGKGDAKRKAFAPTTATLRYDESRSVNPEKAGGNAIIEGENLEVLKLLLCAYRGQVKCIYIDPPYNTGNDFVYKDNFAEGEKAYWELTGQTEGGVKMSTNTRSDGRFHSNWLNMIYPRLLVARQLLRQDGVIFVSIDDNEVTHLRKVMDEVFGEANFIACLPTVMNLKGNNDEFAFAGTHEYTLVYSIDRANAVIYDFKLDDDELEAWAEDDYGPYKQGANLKATGTNAPRSLRPNLFFPLYISNGEKLLLNRSSESDIEIYPITDGMEMSWRWSAQKFASEAHNIILNKVGNQYSIYKKQRPSIGDLPTKKPKTIFYKPEYSSGNGTNEIRQIFGARVFDNPKPIALIRDLISLVANNNDMVLDFFAGSGTTANAVLELNKRDELNLNFLLVQIPEAELNQKESVGAELELVSSTTIERVKRVISGYGHNPQPIESGFKVFTLEKSAFPRAEFKPDPDATEEDQLKELKAFIAQKEASLIGSKNTQAVRDEVLLKCGFQLDVELTPIEEVKGNQVFRARDHQAPPREAIVCFESHIDTATIDWLCQQKGLRVIVLEVALSTTSKWNLHHHLGDGLVVF